mmetsp:Transcript_49543/g.53463  ORF Transcript_49543/g.53463 Transcript_49543/m.53463 type:complete len:583 (+) Transcript_49543:54-1802(+)
MGGRCSKSKGEDLDTSRHVVVNAATLKKSTVAAADSTSIATATATKTKTKSMDRGNNRTSTVEDEFFDAFQSFKDLKSINYPPATKTYHSKLSNQLCIETEPGLLLSSSSPPSSPPPPTTTNDTSNKNGTTKTRNSHLLQQKRDSTIAIRESLKDQTNITTHGYPGELNEEELNACIKFREELKKRDPAYREMVLAYSPAEGESFALCRFLRARDFNVDEVLLMLEENGAPEIWKKTKQHNFYNGGDNLSKFYNGCPVPVLMAIFPIVVSGIAKNGATMFYLRPSFGAGMDINTLECLVENLSDLIPYLWDLLHNRGIDSMVREMECHDPETTTILSERIIVVDLKGMPSALYDKSFMNECNTITNCFPETMNRTYMLNVPMAFSVVWAVIKLFIEPRTLQKIGFFSYEKTATDDLLGYVNSEELLSNYGGSGPSFEDVLQSRQIEYENMKKKKKNSNNNSDNNFTRVIVETMNVGTWSESKFIFDLKSNEKVRSIIIYSKGDNGADFTVSSNKNKIIGKKTNVSRTNDDGGNDKMHYSATIFNDDNDKSASTSIVGPGTFSVVAKGSAKEYYLVTINVVSF